MATYTERDGSTVVRDQRSAMGTWLDASHSKDDIKLDGMRCSLEIEELSRTGEGLHYLQGRV